MLANHRYRENHLSELNGENGPIYTTTEMLDVATSFYKNLFGFESKHNISLDPSLWREDELVTREENDMLQKKFSEEDISEAYFGSFAHGAPSPDGYHSYFIKLFGI